MEPHNESNSEQSTPRCATDAIDDYDYDAANSMPHQQMPKTPSPPRPPLERFVTGGDRVGRASWTYDMMPTLPPINHDDVSNGKPT